MVVSSLGIDLNVSVPGQGNWSMIEYEEAPRADFEQLHGARWIGKP